jgi:2-C-methyl-D-erythritol 2,4-cyclodiphosphate synthase
MKACIPALLEVDEDAVSIKATTTEMLGFVGREEGVSAYCTCLIAK